MNDDIKDSKPNKPYKMSVGRRGEALAAEYLEREGYTVVARNCRVGHDELDLIVENESALVFVEVKSRAQTASNRRYGRPASAVDYNKRQKLIRAAEGYLREHPSGGRHVRIDVLEVYLPAIHEDTPIDHDKLLASRIVHIKNAVWK